MKIGAHLSIRKGFKGAVDEAVATGCDCLQIFVGNPRGWARKELHRDIFSEFISYRKQNNIWPFVVHASYLINPATSDQMLYEKSRSLFINDFRRATMLGADFFVFHPGKSPDKEQGIQQVVTMVNDVLNSVHGDTKILFENQAGSGNELAADFADLGFMMSRVNNQERIGLCFDTCHAFAAGYDLRNSLGREKVISEFDKHIGLSFLNLFHLNDSKGALGSRLDRHQHVGEGEIGIEGFKYLVNSPIFNTIPGILETPQKQSGDVESNLAILRSL